MWCDSVCAINEEEKTVTEVKIQQLFANYWLVDWISIFYILLLHLLCEIDVALTSFVVEENC